MTFTTTIGACGRILEEARKRGHRIDVHPHGAEHPPMSVYEGLQNGLSGWLGPLEPAVVISDNRIDFSAAVPTSLAVDFSAVPRDPVFCSILLGHQRNEMLHVFATDALIMAAVLGMCEGTGCRGIARDVLLAEFVRLHTLLENELILRWKQEVHRENAFDEAIARLICWGVLFNCANLSDGSKRVASRCVFTATSDWFGPFLASLVLAFLCGATAISRWWIANPDGRINMVSHACVKKVYATVVPMLVNAHFR